MNVPLAASNDVTDLYRNVSEWIHVQIQIKEGRILHDPLQEVR